MTLTHVRSDLRKLAKAKKKNKHKSFFKTGKGEYGEGDKFLGVTVPNTRSIAKKYSTIDLSTTEKLLQSKYHEERQVALFTMIKKFDKYSRENAYDNNKRKDIFDLYIKNISHVNNWDLVDISAHKVVGRYLEDKDRGLLYKFARSNDLWKKRIAIISTFWYIKDSDFSDTFKISEILLNDEHDLIHKAVGWALREVGKKDQKVEEGFLKKHYKKMPRTMLRYAIERFPESLRLRYLKGNV